MRHVSPRGLEKIQDSSNTSSLPRKRVELREPVFDVLGVRPYGPKTVGKKLQDGRVIEILRIDATDADEWGRYDRGNPRSGSDEVILEEPARLHPHLWRRNMIVEAAVLVVRHDEDRTVP